MGPGDRLDVDGMLRPTTTSEGRPIHPTEEGIRNFWRWFGDSRAVDALGRPLVVYHWTNEDFDVPRPGGSDQGISGLAIWCSRDAEIVQNAHQDWRAIRGGRGIDHRGELIPELSMRLLEAKPNASSVSPEVVGRVRERIRDRVNEAFNAGRISGKRVWPLFLRMARPAVFSGADEPDACAWDRRCSICLMPKERISDLERAGFDSAIAYENERVVELVVFSSLQVKSAIGNSGAFNLHHDDPVDTPQQRPLPQEEPRMRSCASP